MSAETSGGQHAPVACTLDSAGLGTQVERWRTLYAKAGIHRVETDRGLRICFERDPAVDSELRDLVDVEIRCCTWAGWTIGRNAGELTLDITSAGDGVAVIHSWFLGEAPVVPTRGW
jgi:hypothetical protein